MSASSEVSTNQSWEQLLQYARGLVRAEDLAKVTRQGVRLQDPEPVFPPEYQRETGGLWGREEEQLGGGVSQ